MNQEVAAHQIGAGWLERSALYQEFLAERAELLKHKWLESEKAGHDIGFEAALVSWVVHHRARWRKARCRAQGGLGRRTASWCGEIAASTSASSHLITTRVAPAFGDRRRTE